MADHELIPSDLFDSVFLLTGTDFEICWVSHPATKPERTARPSAQNPGDWRWGPGWRARRISTRSDRGHDRRIWLTPPAGSPEEAVESLRKHGYLTVA